jgi:transcriptional regulator with XRE-family HTH domain
MAEDADGQQQADRVELGRRIRALRKSRDLSIHRLAELAGISAGYLSDVERGSSSPSAEKLARVASALGVTTDYLLTGATSAPAPVEVPPGLAAAAEQLDLTYTQTVRLLSGKRSLVARRSSHDGGDDWSKTDWIEFYNKAKHYL